MATTNTKTVNTTGALYDSGTYLSQNWIEVTPAQANTFAIEDNTLSSSIKLLGSGDTIYIEGNFADFQYKQNGKTITLDNGFARSAITLNSMTSNKTTGVVTTTLIFLDGSVTLSNKAGGVKVSITGIDDNGNTKSQQLTTKYADVKINADGSNTTAATYFADLPVNADDQVITLNSSQSSYVGDAGNDTFIGTIGTNATFTTGISIDGSGGVNTLRLNDTATAAAATTLTTPTGMVLTNVQNLVLNASATSTSTTANISGSSWGSVTGTTINAISDAVVTGSSTNALTVYASAAAVAGTSSVNGGSSITAIITGADLGTNHDVGSAVNIGTTTATTGAVNLTVSNSSSLAAGSAEGGLITVTGGSTVTVNQTIASSNAAGSTAVLTQGQVNVNGTASTTAVTINQSATSTTIEAGATNVLDVNRASTTAAGKITTVTLNNSGAAVVNSGALNTLNLSGTLTTVNAGTLGALTTAANTALALNLNSATSTGAVTIDTDIKTINIASTGTASTIASLVDASATAINIAGSAATTITATTISSAAVITSTNTAGTTLSAQLATGVNFIGGAGADSISIAATTKAINMGDGNDTVIISTTTLGAGGSVNGGSGTNTIVANTNGSILIANPAFSNFTTLRVAGNAAQGTHVATGFTALQIGTTAGLTTFSSVAAGVGLTMLAGPTGGTTVELTDATGSSNVFGLTLSSDAQLVGGVVTIQGVETVNITNTDTLTTTVNLNSLTLTDAAATTVNVTGNTTLTLTATGSAAITTMNASGLVVASVTTAGIEYTSVNTTVGATVAITGTNGIDYLTGTANAIDTIIGGTGADRITWNGNSDVFTGGAGNDNFVINALGTSTVFLDITDAAAGDTLTFTNNTQYHDNGNVTFTQAAITLGAGATFAQYLDAAAAGNGALDSIVDWFAFGGNTYVVMDNSAGATFVATDGVIELSGIVNLSSSTMLTAGVVTIV